MKKNIQKALLMIGIVFFFTSCQQQKLSHDPRVNIVDDIKAYPFEITLLNTRINSGGFLEVQVEGLNLKSGYKQLEYMIRWYDKDGFRIRSIFNDKWREFPVFRNQSFNFNAISPNDKAFDLEVFIRDTKLNKYNVYNSKEVN